MRALRRKARAARSTSPAPAKRMRSAWALLLTLAAVTAATSGCERERTTAIETDAPDADVVQAILIIGGGLGEQTLYTNNAIAFVPDEQRFYDIADMPTVRRAMGYTAHEGLLYVYGGWTPAPDVRHEPVAATEIYDPMTDTWRRGADMPRPTGKMGHSYAEVDGRIYVGGGERPGDDGSMERLSDFFVYHIAEDRWDTLESMPGTRTFPYVIANPDDPALLHFVAGNTDAFHDMSDWHHVYDTRTGEWNVDDYAPFPVDQTDGDGTIMYDGRWWIFGGWNREGHLNVTKAYDFDEDEWLAMPRPDVESWTHQGAAVAEVDGERRIYMMGGRIDREDTDAIWYYDGDGWHELAVTMPTPRWNFVAVTMDLNVAELEPIE